MGRIGVVLELRCETDFCSRSGEFRAWCEDLAMQVAATNPASVDELLAQPFIKDESKTVADHIQALRSMVGERLVVAGFARREVGR